MKLTLDPWQRDFLACNTDKILCTGRQVGKSEVCGMDAGEYAAKHPNKTTLMIAPTERQAYALFDKTFDYLNTNYPNKIKMGRDRPTKKRINLTNGHTIWCLPTGISGIGVRFLTVHRLYIDEASRVPEEVFTAVTPMLLTTAGIMIMLSTPAGCQGLFYDTWNNKGDAFNSFKRFSIDSETCIRNREICKTWTEVQRDKGLQHLERERARKSNAQYSQEYMGRFVESLHSYFPLALIKRAMHPKPKVKPVGDHFAGLDIARMGEDQTVLFSVCRQRRDRIVQTDMEITEKTRLTDTVRLVLQKDSIWGYKKIYIDTGGMGVGVFDPLLEEEQTRRKVVSIDNATRALEFAGTKSKRLMKEDLYNNLLRLFEQGKIELFDDPNILLSLRSVQYEYTKNGNMRIFGEYSHITEALVRAAWCMASKDLNLWCY